MFAIKSYTDGRIYVGMSQNIEKRLKEHNSGKVFSTKGYKPWHLVYSEKCSDRLHARKKEKYYKSGYGKEHLKNIINNSQNLLFSANENIE